VVHTDRRSAATYSRERDGTNIHGNDLLNSLESAQIVFSFSLLAMVRDLDLQAISS